MPRTRWHLDLCKVHYFSRKISAFSNRRTVKDFMNVIMKCKLD